MRVMRLMLATMLSLFFTAFLSLPVIAAQAQFNQFEQSLIEAKLDEKAQIIENWFTEDSAEALQLMQLIIHGGRTVVLHAAKHDYYRSQWITEEAQRRNINIASVAVANKNVRTAWALLTRNSEYKTTPLAA